METTMLEGLGPRSPLTRYLLLNEGEGGDGGGGGGGTGGGGTPPPADDSVPKSKVDEIVKGRVAETKQATERAIAEQLGVPISEAKAILEAHNKRVEGEKSEAQREKEAAQREKQAAEAAKAEAAKEKRDLQVERALIRAGVKDEKLDRAKRMIDADDDADADALKKAAEQLKSEEPMWFGDDGSSGGGKPPKAPASDSGGKPPKDRKSEDAYSRGADRAKSTTGSAGDGPGGYKLPGHVVGT